MLRCCLRVQFGEPMSNNKDDHRCQTRGPSSLEVSLIGKSGDGGRRRF